MRYWNTFTYLHTLYLQNVDFSICPLWSERDAIPNRWWSHAVNGFYRVRGSEQCNNVLEWTSLRWFLAKRSINPQLAAQLSWVMSELCSEIRALPARLFVVLSCRNSSVTFQRCKLDILRSYCQLCATSTPAVAGIAGHEHGAGRSNQWWSGKCRLKIKERWKT